MTVTASLAGASTDRTAVSVHEGFVLPAASPAGVFERVRAHPLEADAPDTARPRSARRQALLQTARGQAMQVQAMADLGHALQAHGVAPLVALRLAKGLSQKALCEACGLPQPHVSRLENGKVPNPDAATLQRLAKALGVSMDEVLAAIEAGAAA